MLLQQLCSLLSTILFGIITPDCGLIQAQQYCSILLTTRNNVAATTLLHSVFNNLLQLNFWPCTRALTQQIAFTPVVQGAMVRNQSLELFVLLTFM